MTTRLDRLPAADWARFSRLLDALLAVADAERAAWLANLPDADSDLRGLLAEAADAERALAAAANAPRLPAVAGEAEHYAFERGQTVGPYQLESPLGTGGMGEVWLARRHDGSLGRAVALKLPHPWLLSTAQRRRLARERDFLAGLTHDNIARLYDAGIAPDGQPWLALEHVEGLRIDHYCRQRQLGVAGRLLLFDQVLDAVEAAHARLIVHRDLKPANILVTDDGRVKLLDFGVAKLLDDARTGEHTELTRITGRAITPEYAAPEQRTGDAVTPAIDIYSLGVILHELLCGQRPAAPVPGGARPLASQRVLPAHAETVGGLRPSALQRALRGDLDAILAKALAGDPRHRYGSVERFGEDLIRHRRSEPIAARRIGALESAGRYLRRNRIVLGVAAALLVSISGGVWASLSQAERAMREAQRANATRDFLLRMLAAGSRLQAQDREPGALTVREMIDRIVDGADTDLADQPETRLELLGIAKSVYRQWYQRERAFAAHEQYRSLVEQVAGPNDPRIIESLIEQAAIYSEYPDPPIGRAALLSEASVRIRRAGLGGSLLDAQRLTEIGRDLTPVVGGSAAAIEALQHAVGIHDRLDSRHRTRVWASHYLVQALVADGQLDRARTVLDTALERARALQQGQRNDWAIACLLIERGHLERADGAAAAARQAYDEGLQLALATFGREIDNVQLALGWQATLLDWDGQHDAADAIFAREAAALADTLTVTEVGDSNEGPAWFYLLHARHLLAQGRAAEALPMLEKASVIETTTQPAPFTRADALVTLGEALGALGRHDEAGRRFQSAVDSYALYGQPQHEGALQARLRWIQHRLQQGLLRPADAADALQALLQTAAERPGLTVAEAALDLADLASAAGDADGAARSTARAARALDGTRALVDPRGLAALRARLAARTG